MIPDIRYPIKKGSFTIVTIALIVVFTLLYSAASLFRHSHFGSYEDLAMFDQMLWNVREGRGLLTSISGNAHLLFVHHFFSEHVSPLLYLLAWPAGLTSGPEALLVIQALALALSAWPAARIVAIRLHAPWAGLLAAMVWLALPGLWGAVLYDFHMEVFEAVFLFAFWWALMKGRLDAWLWAVLYVACKEDAPLYLTVAAAVGGWLFQQRRLGFTVAAFSAVYAVLAIAWIGPVYSDSGHTLVQARLLTPASVGGLDVWLRQVTFHADRWITLGQTLLGFAGLPLLGGLALLPGLAAIGIMWLSCDLRQFSIDLHYPFTVYPLLFLAAVEGARRFQHIRSNGLVYSPWIGRIVPLGLLIGLIGAWSLDKGWCLNMLAPATGLRHRGLDEAKLALKQIPATDTVAASLTLAPHVARRATLELLTTPRQALWIALRIDRHYYPLTVNEYNEGMARLLAPDSPFGFMGPSNSFVAVFHRNAPKTLNPVMREYHRLKCQTLEAEDLHHKTGRKIIDHLALNEYAWQTSGNDPWTAIFFGRYMDLPAGPYRVTFRVRPESPGPDPVARLEVTEKRGQYMAGMTQVSGSSTQYQDVILDVMLTGGGDVEFRGFKIGHGSLTIDSIRWERRATADADPAN